MKAEPRGVLRVTPVAEFAERRAIPLRRESSSVPTVRPTWAAPDTVRTGQCGLDFSYSSGPGSGAVLHG